MEAKMKKRWISAVISAALLLVAGWMIFLKPSSKLCSYVPDHAAWYVETSQPGKVLKELELASRPLSDSGLSLVAELHSGLAELSLVFSGRKDIFTSLNSRPFGISAHALAGSEAGYVFYVSSESGEQSEILKVLESRFRSKEGYRFEKREYLGETMAEISKKGGKTLSIAFLKNAIAASFSGFLVEEVLRNSGVLLQPGFASRLSRDPRFRHIENKDLRLFLHTGNFPEYLRGFLQSQEPEIMEHTGDAMVLGLEGFSNMELEFQGFSLSRESVNSSGKMLNPALKDFLPPGIEVVSLQLGSAGLWSSLLKGNKEEEARTALLQNALEDEVLVALVEGQGLKKYDHLLLAGVKDKVQLEQFMQSVSGKESPPFLYREEYRGVSLFKHRQQSLAKELGGRFFSGWSAPCYALVDSRLYLSDQMDLLRQCVDAALEKKPSRETENQASCFRFEALPGRMIPYFMENAGGTFRKTFREWLPFIKSVRKISMSDMGEGEDPGISLKLSLKLPELAQDSLRPLAKIFLDSTIVAGPVRLGFSESGNPLWLAQDIKKQVHFLDEQLNLKGSIGLSDFWIRDPLMLKRNHSDKYSVLFTLPSRTCVYSPDARPETDFAFVLNDSLASLSHTALVDYDHSLQYRLFAASRYGFMLASDASGQLLPGWNPRKTNVPLALPPRHIRVAGRDYILMLDRQGSLHLTNRKGEMQPGFPFKLKGDVFSGIFLEPGLEEENSFIYCLSELGQMEKVNLRGKQVSFLQLFRPEVDTRFILCPDQKERTFVVARTGTHSLTLFDQSYRPVLDYKAKGSRFLIRHFQFGSSSKIFSVTDLDAKECQLFNESGMPVLKSAFPSTGPADVFPVPQSDGRFRVFSVFENRASLGEFFKN